MIQQPRDTALSASQFRITSDSSEPAAIYLQPPDSPRDDTDVYRESSWTVIDVSEYGYRGEGTTGFHLLIHGDGHGDENLSSFQIEHDITVSADGFLGDDFRAQDRTALDLEQLPVTPT